MKIRKLIALVLSLAMLAAFFSGCSGSGETGEEEFTANDDALNITQPFYDAPKLLTDSGSGSGIWDYFADALKLSGKTLISSTISSFVSSGVSSLLTDLGFDMRSIEQKKLDKIDEELQDLQNSVTQGFQNVMRKQVQIYNETVMDELLSKFDEVQDPVIVLMRTLNDIAEKEASGQYTDEELEQQRLTFAKNCDSLKFSTLSSNTAWYSARMLATSVMSPSKSNSSITLWSLYEDTFGALESWDYMTVKPRTEFICYLAFLVNGLAQLSKIAADYELSLLPEGDSNRLTITGGVNTMALEVNKMNELFQEELLKLEEIQKRHDEEHIITHRDRSTDSEGNIVITEGMSLSTRILPINNGNSDYNYAAYNHDEGASFIKDGSGVGAGGCYHHYIYTLSCAKIYELYETLFDEYRKYAKSLGYSNYTDFTMKDYLATIGFTCRDSEKDYFTKSEGFYIGTVDITGSTDSTTSYNSLVTAFESFKTQSLDMVQHSIVQISRSWWNPSNPEYTKKINLGHWYLCFLQPDQETLAGEITTTEISLSSTGTSTITNLHFKGTATWSKDMGTEVKLRDEHK